MSTFTRRVLSIGVLIFAILACNLPQPISPSDSNAAATAVALTIAAIVQQSISPTFLPASAPPPPTATDIFTPLPTLSPTLTLTPTLSTPLISVSVDTNCRVGPGKVYDRVGGLLVGQTAQVYAKDPSNYYWYIRNPDDSTSFCWVWGEYATVTGNISSLPVYTPPPTPTQAPNFELSFAGVDTCVGWWVELELKNTGPDAFKSFSLSIRDIPADVVITDAGNGFSNIDGCLSSSMIPTVEPEESVVISTPAFSYNPENHRIRANVTLCTGLNQSGQCVTQTIDFKP